MNQITKADPKGDEADFSHLAVYLKDGRVLRFSSKKYFWGNLDPYDSLLLSIIEKETGTYIHIPLVHIYKIVEEMKK